MAFPLALSVLLLLLIASTAAAVAVAAAAAALVGLRLRRRPWLPPAEPAAAALRPPTPAGQEGPADEGGREKRRRRKARRKQQQQKGGDEAAGGDEVLMRLPRFPLASVAGALQRRITSRYGDLARASQADSLTLDQVREFIDCLVDARNDLLQKSENAQRSFRIKKAMLSIAHNRRSSYDHLRLCEQVHKLESEHERLKKDAAIYNYLQEQLQLSPTYKSMVELNAVMEKEAVDDDEAPEISFEELLAQEKKDAAFWQRNGKLRTISGK